MSDSIVFGRFELLPAQRRLLERGAPVTLGSRAFDLLVALVEERDRVLSKEKLLHLVWHDVVVEENNLTVQIATLRKVLGADAVATVSGHGYRFTLPVTLARADSSQPNSIGSAADLAALKLPDKPSIAVLPLARAGGDAAHDDFIDGITDELITALSRFHSLFVVARGSVFSYRGRAVDVRTVGRELGVRYVLDGSVHLAGLRVRVAVQLIDAVLGHQIWAERYERDLNDIFTLQDEVANAIVSALAPQIETVEVHRVQGSKSRDASAQELALHAWARSRDGLRRSNAGERDQAIALARQALAIDPHSSLALNALVDALSWHLYYATATSREAALAEALAAATRALEIDCADHLAWRGRGWLRFSIGQIAEALFDLARSVALNPNDCFALARLGVCEAVSGDPARGTALCLDALRRSPRDPSRFHLLDNLVWAHFASQAYREGTDAARQALREGDFAGTRLCLVLCLVGAGDMPAAAAELRLLRERAPAMVAARIAGVWLATGEVREREIKLLAAADAFRPEPEKVRKTGLHRSSSKGFQLPNR
ncbi:MAG: winged helix-turn-helix domain-containing protein [Burkholderiales bacterium]